MNYRKESIADLRQKLPYGSFKRIHDRLLEREIKFSLQYISRCLNPDQPDYNRIIIEEAIKLVEEYTIQMSEMRQRIELLNSSL